MTLTNLSFIYVYLPLSLLVYYLLPSRHRAFALLAVSLGYCIFAQRIEMGLLIFAVSGLEGILSASRRQDFTFKNIAHFLLHCIFFPKLYAGPLQEYDGFERQLQRVEIDCKLIAEGFGRFAVGALKVLLPSRHLMEIYAILTGRGWGEVSMATGWLVVLSLALAVYYQISGWCDMAQGIGAMFGLRLVNNVYYPYQSRSVNDFVQRFNSTVWAFLQRMANQTFPLWHGRAADTVITLGCGLLFGAWLGLWTGHRDGFILWGLYIGVVLLIERYVCAGLLEGIPTLFRRGLTLFLVLLGFGIVAGEIAGQGAGYLRMMFRMDGVMLVGSEFMYLLSSRWLILLLSCFFATNACGLLAGKLKKALPAAYTVLSVSVGVCMLLWVTALQY